jgi:hypothetical protein
MSRVPRSRALTALLVSGAAAAALAGPSAGSALAAQLEVAPGATITEGDSGQRLLEFDASLSGVVNQFVVYTADWQTIPGTATPGVDYVPASGTVRLTGTQHQKLVVPIVGDSEVEPDETVGVELSNPQPASDPKGIPTVSPAQFGTIVNDDLAAPAAPSIAPAPAPATDPAAPAATVVQSTAGPATTTTTTTATDDVGAAVGITFHGMRKKLKVTLRCPADEQLCKGRLQVRLDEKAMKTVFFRLRGGQSARLAIPMSARQRHALRDAGNFYLKAIATDAAGNRFAHEVNVQL